MIRNNNPAPPPPHRRHGSLAVPAVGVRVRSATARARAVAPPTDTTAGDPRPRGSIWAGGKDLLIDPRGLPTTGGGWQLGWGLATGG